MIPNENGRYCTVCQKTIHDYTQLSNKELVDRLEQNTKVCARFKQSQLNTNLMAQKNNRTTKTVLFLSFISSIFISPFAYSQTTNPEARIERITNSATKFNSNIENQSRDTIKITGIVNCNNEPVIGISINVKDKNIGTYTNELGRFSLTIPDGELPLTINFSYVGFISQEVVINNQIAYLTIDMEEDENMIMGEIVVVRKLNIFQRIYYFFVK